MSRYYFVFSVVLSVSALSQARVLIVEKTGIGQYTSIQAGVNAAFAGDTVIVYPGVYNEQVNISKDIVLQGSGYEWTQIVANADPAVSITAGKMRWFGISSNIGRGVTMAGGILTNCIVWNCPNRGIDVTGGTNSLVQNCDLVNNAASGGSYQAFASNGVCTLLNTVVWTVGRNYGDQVSNNWGSTMNVLYCLVSNSGTGNLSANPQFKSSTNFALIGGSPCIDAGKPDIYDPDGSRSDIGYYGGQDAPVFPVVTNLSIYLNPDGTVNVQATGESRY